MTLRSTAPVVESTNIIQKYEGVLKGSGAVKSTELFTTTAAMSKLVVMATPMAGFVATNDAYMFLTYPDGTTGTSYLWHKPAAGVGAVASLAALVTSFCAFGQGQPTDRSSLIFHSLMVPAGTKVTFRSNTGVPSNETIAVAAFALTLGAATYDSIR